MIHRYVLYLCCSHFRALTLFFCAFSSQQIYGLGDYGQNGIDTFAEEHICNSICKSLRLTPADEILEAALRKMQAAGAGSEGGGAVQDTDSEGFGKALESAGSGTRGLVHYESEI